MLISYSGKLFPSRTSTAIVGKPRGFPLTTANYLACYSSLSKPVHVVLEEYFCYNITGFLEDYFCYNITGFLEDYFCYNITGFLEE
jgi:hypothetical protein